MKTLLYILISCYSFQLLSQTRVSPKLYAKELKNANYYFETEDYANALRVYRRVLSIDPAQETANFNSAVSRFRLGLSADSALRELANIKSTDFPELEFYLGVLNHQVSSFDEAALHLNKYRDIPVKIRNITNEEVDYYLSCVKHAKEFTSQPHRSIIKNLGAKINSEYDDYVPLITPDESVLYFTSRRSGGTGLIKDGDGKYYEDVYMSQKAEDGSWGDPKNIGSPINTNTHDACVALSFDGNQMIIYRTSADKLTGDLYICHTDYNGWSEPQKLGPEMNTPYIETSACFSTDTSVIYFSSSKPGGYGGRDLYRIKKLPNGRWSMPQNLGPTINTPRDEDAPYLHPDGTTLYFSSKGHNSMGDYDIYKTILNTETNEFSAPDNLGYPINTVLDDRFFVLNTNGTRGYYSSAREGGLGGHDLYMIDTRFGDNDLKVKHGLVMIGNEPGKAKITLIDIESKQISGIYNASSKTGRFMLVMNPVKTYKLIAEEEGCQTIILDLEPLASEQTDNELILNLTRKK